MHCNWVDAKSRERERKRGRRINWALEGWKWWGRWGTKDMNFQICALNISRGFPGNPDSKLQCGRPRLNPRVGKIPWRREWLPTAVLLSGEFHGQRSLGRYSPWGCKKSDTAKWLALSLSTCFFPRILAGRCVGEEVVVVVAASGKGNCIFNDVEVKQKRRSL